MVKIVCELLEIESEALEHIDLCRRKKYSLVHDPLMHEYCMK